MTRTLSLSRETLTELTAGELSSVAGASGLTCEILTGICPTFECTGHYTVDTVCG